jgi:HK97 family phage major capsid protein
MTSTHDAIKRAFDARRRNQDELQGLYVAAEGRDLDADESAKEAAIVSELRDLSDREMELVELAEKEARSAEYFSNSAAAGISNEAPASNRRHLGDVLRGIANGEERQQRIELRDDVALTAGTATDGAEMLQTDLDKNLVDYLQESIGAMQAGARVILTSGGNPITIPTVATHSTVLLEGETDAIARSAPQFSSVALGAYKYAVLVQASRELLEDAAFPFVPFIIEQATDELARLVGTELITGSGSGAPEGIDLGTTGSTSSAVDAWTADELIDVFHAIASPYRQNATWIMNDSTVQTLRKLKDSTGQYLWQPGMIAGAADMLYGKPVVTDNAVMALGTGNESLIFGDIKRGYTVRVVGGLDVARSDDFAFDTDLATWRFVARVDGAIVDQAAFVVGHNA